MATTRHVLFGYRYVHVLIQKMAVNADLGFILALVDFFSFKSYDPSFEVSVCIECTVHCKHVGRMFMPYNSILFTSVHC